MFTFESQFYRLNKEMLSNLSYFEDKLIGRSYRRTRKAPLFSFNIWSCYATPGKDISRTKNLIEDGHNSFNSTLSALYPSIWTLINALKKEETLTFY